MPTSRSSMTSSWPCTAIAISARMRCARPCSSPKFIEYPFTNLREIVDTAEELAFARRLFAVAIEGLAEARRERRRGPEQSADLLEGVAARAVAPEQFLRQRLQAIGRVDAHQGRVMSGQAEKP